VRVQDVRARDDARGGAPAAPAPPTEPKDGRAWLSVAFVSALTQLPGTQVNSRRALFKKLMERCKRFKLCPFCAAAQGAHAWPASAQHLSHASEPGIVKRAGSSMKIVHDKYSKHADLLVRAARQLASRTLLMLLHRRRRL